MVVRLDTGVGQNGLQLSQCCPNLMTAALHWVRAGALRKMLIVRRQTSEQFAKPLAAAISVTFVLDMLKLYLSELRHDV
jgi:hypothetical protein